MELMYCKLLLVLLKPVLVRLKSTKQKMQQRLLQLKKRLRIYKDAVIAAGIALRGMAKGGKFAAKENEEKSANAVNGAVASAVNKVLSTLVAAIRNRVDEGLKEINKVLGEIKQG
ncbi:Borrelia lipoprotein-containing protein (plasmid) [Borrelia crocidurae str. Achema]|uniref:Variable large protein n=1 Tax=Borrelia crocidurae (strain Achema) TaxID=1155096 RepID=I0FDZ3_BORCA|nr:Borrelia lipoprotein-containing protein [Borrelia crocidurae str. Achema]